MQQIPTGIGSTGTFSTANRLVSVASSGVVKQSQEADAVTGGVLSFTATLTGNRALTLPDADTTITGGGTLALRGFTLTVPATGTAALLATANTFTVAQTIDTGTGALPAELSNVLMTYAGADATAVRAQFWGFGATALNFAGRYIGGTRASNSATTSGGVMCRLSGLGYDTALTTAANATIDLMAGSLWAAGNRETAITLNGTSNGSTTNTEWLRLKTLGAMQQLSGAAPSANTFPGNLLAGRNNAAADTVGMVGETIESKISTATNAAGTGTYLALTSITLTAGKWRIAAMANQVPNGATFTANAAAETLIGTTSASNAGTTAGYDRAQTFQQGIVNGQSPVTIPSVIVNITGSTTYYLNVLCTYTIGTAQWIGSISAERLA